MPPVGSLSSQGIHAFQERLGPGSGGFLIFGMKRVAETVSGRLWGAAANRGALRHQRAVGTVMAGLAAAVAASAAFAVKGADLWLAQIREHTLAAGRVSHPRASWGPVSFFPGQQGVQVIHTGPPAAGSLESPFVADAQIFLI